MAFGYANTCLPYPATAMLSPILSIFVYELGLSVRELHGWCQAAREGYHRVTGQFPFCGYPSLRSYG